ncbi:hypothetical protein LAB1_49540 [Roseibium sp. LAB1]
MPFGIGLWSVPASAAREVPTKPVHPFVDRFTADTNTPLHQDIFNICLTQRKAMVGPNRVGNDRTRKTKALKAWKITG